MRKIFGGIILAGLLATGLGLSLAQNGDKAAEAEDKKPAAGKAVAKADDENPRLWQPRTKSVAVFKNGMGFFMREGAASLHEGWLVAREIPPAAFGTLMIFSVRKDEVVDIVGSGPGEIVEFDGVDAGKDLPTKRARLAAVKHLNVQLSYKHKGAQQQAAGKLVSIGADFVVLETPSSNFAVPVDGITRLQVLDLPLRVHVNRDDGKQVADARVGMAYLRQGITWIPEYTLKIIDDNTAELMLRGTLVNEAEDLVHCDVNFVVGVPHFAHTAYMAPIAVGQVIRTIGTAIAPEELRTQIMNRAQIVNNATAAPGIERPGVIDKIVPPDGGKLKDAVNGLPVLESPGGTDYTVYTKKDLTVRRGERAIVTLFTRKIPYRHLYRWSPPDALQHLLVLENVSETAWTTGPCLAVSGDRPLTEDLLKYTPRAARSELPVTTAINIAHDKVESETDRKFRAHSPSQHVFFDLVTLDGEVRLRNFEKKPSHLIINVKVPGRPVEVSDNGSKTSDPTKLELLNREGSLRWDLRLNPGETKVLRYKYERYVRSN